jgi:hypothetical protein
MEWSRRSLLVGMGMAAACSSRQPAPPPYVPPPLARPRNLVIVQAYGGWDTTYSIDPKPDSAWMDIPEGDVRTFGGLPIWVHPGRPRSGRFFERHHERVAIVHGLNVRSVDHTQCLRWILTGTRDPLAPDACAVVASELGADLPIPYLLLSDRAFLGPFGGEAARSGGMNQIAALADRSQRFPPLDGTVPLDPGAQEQAAMDAWRAARQTAREGGELGELGEALAARQDFPRALTRASGLREVADWLGTAGAPQNLGSQVATAMSILEGGLTRAVMLDSREYYDTHGRNDEQVVAQENTFAALDSLFVELASRPGREGGSLFDETVVAVISEMGRSQVINDNGGKDHWPFASVLLAGAGVQGDQVYGATDDAFLGVPVDLATGAPTPGGEELVAERFVAGLLASVGVDPTPWLGEIPAFHGFYRV